MKAPPLHQSAYTSLHNYALLVAAGSTNATTLQGRMAGRNSPGSCSTTIVIIIIITIVTIVTHLPPVWR